jgi:hypothetical protein
MPVAWEVYVASVEDATKVWKVSRELSLGWAGGGGQPRWRADGTELFYIVRNDTVMSVRLDRTVRSRTKKRSACSASQAPGATFPTRCPGCRKYDVTGDRQRFVFVRTVARLASQ